MRGRGRLPCAGSLQKNWTHIFRPSMMELVVKMDFRDDARHDYEFRIPVVQSRRALYLALGIVVTVALGIVGEWIWNWAQTGSLTGRWTGAALAVCSCVAIAVALGVCAWDFASSYRRAKRIVENLKPTTG